MARQAPVTLTPTSAATGRGPANNSITGNPIRILEIGDAEQEDTDDVLWNRKAELVTKSQQLDRVVKEFYAYCQATRNVHKKIKD